jgi:cellulose synthase/poly-beta-1,6-N-acetylglucosamine synthase-like glycosyltransferase
MNFELFLIIATFCYSCLVILFIYGLTRTRDRAGHATPFVSVIIAARNEENNIEDCLSSVLRQTYPANLFEVIVVDDNSTDSTAAICQRFMAQFPNLLCVSAPENDDLRGKPNALACGIDASHGDVILITDADCTVPSTWVECTAHRYEGNIGLIGGVTLQRNINWFEGMQSLDWAFILGMAASTAGLGHQHGSIGNNLSFRKKAYDQVGGYRKLKFSVTEDYTIVQAIIDSGDWDYIYPVDPKTTVESKPCPDWKMLLRQKHRWGKGALDMKFSGFAIMAIGFCMHLAPFIMLYWGEVVLSASMLMVKFIFDYMFLYRFLKRVERLADLKWFYYFEVYFIIYVILLPFLVFFGGKVQWKGRSF